jgi:hypothetical protein
MAVCMGMVIGGFATLERERQLGRAWRLALRVALVASVLAAALGAAMYHFLGADPVVIVAVFATVGLAVGVRLPPAQPAWVAREFQQR